METPIDGVAFRATGRVQGVGFRWFTCGAAEEFRVTGWVRNRPDGAVEGEAFGKSDALERFFERLLHGPPSGRVDHLERTSVTRDASPRCFETRF